jgi:KaiC/GvpD/RAD55 family RecA-like ATPase
VARERLIVALQSSEFPRTKSGIPGYDELVDGGFHKGTVNTITGSSGAGKTVFACQFIHSGIKAGEKGMIITPSESAEYLKREMMSSFGWDFSTLEKEGKLSIIDVTDPVLRLQKSIEIDPVDFLINFRKLVERKLEETKPARLFIDDLTAFFMAVDAPFKVRSLTDDLFGNYHRHRFRYQPVTGVRRRLRYHAQPGAHRQHAHQIDIYYEDARLEDR